MGWPHSISRLFRYEKNVTLLFFCLANFSFDLQLLAVSSSFHLLHSSLPAQAHPPFQRRMGKRERRSGISLKVSLLVGGQHGRRHWQFSARLEVRVMASKQGQQRALPARMGMLTLSQSLGCSKPGGEYAPTQFPFQETA